MWRWDQGRLNYFTLTNVRKIASVLVDLDGTDLTIDEDLLRAPLERVVALPFAAPPHYKVWRNYARVFKVLGLASNAGKLLVATETCKSLAASGDAFISYDEYLQHLAKSFYYPSPAFQNYNNNESQQFPFCAILKFLISRTFQKSLPHTTQDEVFSYLIANKVTGTEDLSYYGTLKKRPITPKNDERRQVREMLIFLSQLSYLSWIDGSLFIDPIFLNSLSGEELNEITTPIQKTRDQDPNREIQNIFGPINNPPLFTSSAPPNSEDLFFTEGKKTRVSHLRTERNRKVVEYYFDNTPNGALCDVCKTEVRDRYPWVNNLIEVHHILPLSSPLHVDRRGTSIDDLVGLCPNCHRATHAFYRSYLVENNINDFESSKHAKDVYSMVKCSLVSI